MTPEQLARQQIDTLLCAAGWAVQDYADYNPAPARGIALREVRHGRIRGYECHGHAFRLPSALGKRV